SSDLFGLRQWHGTTHEHAAREKRPDFQLRAHGFAARLHDLQAETWLTLAAYGQDSPIVLNLEVEGAVVRRKRQRDLSGPPVSKGVVHGLLGDSEQVRGHDVVSDEHRLRAVKSAAYAVELGHAVSQLTQGRHQTVGNDRDRVTTAAQLAYLSFGLPEQLRQTLRVVGFGQRFLGQLFMEHIVQIPQAGELLAQPVMEVLADAPLHVFADFQELAFQSLALGDLPF